MAISEQRGFALYVGMSETKARAGGVELGEIVDALRHELARRIPLAESQALAVIAPVDDSARDLEVVMRAVGEHAPEPEEPSPSPDSPEETGVVIDLARHRVLVEKRDAHLTYKELAILQLLVQGGGETITREQLRRAIAAGDGRDVNDRTIDVYIRRLRVRFGAHSGLVRTVHGQGYRFDARRDVTVLPEPNPPPKLS
jgi:DNA-binding winged helix-turn-helix (wHTH) protein